MVRILSRRATPTERVSDDDAMVRDSTEPVTAGDTTDPATERDTADRPTAMQPASADDTVVARQPAVSDRVGPVSHDTDGGTTYGRVGPVADDRVGPVTEDRVGPVEHDRVGPVGEDRAGPVPEPVPVPARPRWNRVSFGATLGLILGLTALYAVLTGTLAQVGLLLGVLGFLLASAGFAGARRDGVTGHSLALLGMLSSAAAIVLGVLAISDTLSWLSTGRDNVPLVRDWVNAHLPWIRNW